MTDEQAKRVIKALECQTKAVLGIHALILRLSLYAVLTVALIVAGLRYREKLAESLDLALAKQAESAERADRAVRVYGQLL